jgi:hypothetical protein
MTSLKPVSFRDRDIWVYDASFSVLFAQVIQAVEEMPTERRPVWWPAVVQDLRRHAAITFLSLDLDLGLDDTQREEFAQLIDDASAALLGRRTFTPDEAAAWKVLDDISVVFRGTEPVDLSPAADVGDALTALIRGTLPPAPPGTWWFCGAPKGRSTIPMAGRVHVNAPCSRG